MYAVTSNPWQGFVQGAYADYSAVRPAKILGCALKQPAAALRWAVEQQQAGASLVSLADNGVIRVGLEQEAVGFSFGSYRIFNDDGPDIEDSVNDVWALIRVDELGIDY